MNVLLKRRLDAIDRTDAMPSELRQCVHEYGLPVVQTLLDAGVTKPKNIRQVVKEIWSGQRQEQQNTGTMNALDVLLAYGRQRREPFRDRTRDRPFSADRLPYQGRSTRS